MEKLFTRVRQKSKLQIPKFKQIRMEEIKKDKPYDLAERTFVFAKDVISFIKSLPRNICNIEIARQLVRSAGSVGANYIEANEALSKKDFMMRVKICRKECKESQY
jgi:hypothetical protein